MEFNSPKYYSINTDQWPLARVIFNCNPGSLEEIEEFLDMCRKHLYNRKGKFVLFVNTNGWTTPNPTHLYRLITFMQEMEPLTKKHMIELALLIESEMVRTIIEWIKSMKTPVVPWIVLSDHKSYSDWMSNLEDRQILFPI